MRCPPADGAKWILQAEGKYKTMKKRLSVLLVATILLTMVFAACPVYATGNDPYAGFTIRTLDDWAKVNSNGSTSWTADGQGISGFWPGDWAVFKSMNFGEKAPVSVELVAVTALSAVLELRLDSLTGDVVARFEVSGSDWVTQKKYTTQILKTFTGVHDLYMVAADGTTAEYYSIKFSNVVPTKDPYTGFQPWVVDGYDNGTAQAALNFADGSLSSVWPGSWVVYKNVDFGETGAASVDIYAATNEPYNGSSELRLDSPTGPAIATFDVIAAGWTTQTKHSVEITKDFTGVHDVYLVSLSGTADYTLIQFYRATGVTAVNADVLYDAELIRVVFGQAINDKSLKNECFVLKDAAGNVVATEFAGYHSATDTADIRLLEYLSVGNDYTLTVGGMKTMNESKVKQQSISYHALGDTAEISELSFVNESSAVIEQLAGAASVSAKVTLTNQTSGDKTFMLILVVSDAKGKPVLLKCETKGIASGRSDTITANGTSMTFAEGYAAKIYLWDVTDGNFVPMRAEEKIIGYQSAS